VHLKVATEWGKTWYVTGDTVCPTHYQTQHFFNNSNTNEDIAMKFEQGYVRYVRNEEECVCSVPNCCDTVISGKIIKQMPGSVASGTHCIISETVNKIPEK
jgi:hypothetical protein